MTVGPLRLTVQSDDVRTAWSARGTSEIFAAQGPAVPHSVWVRSVTKESVQGNQGDLSVPCSRKLHNIARGVRRSDVKDTRESVAGCPSWLAKPTTADPVRKIISFNAKG